MTVRTSTDLRFICLDTETTGLSDQYDRICEIAAVEFDPRTLSVIGRYQTYLNPQRRMPYGAYRVHGLSDDFLANKPLFADVAPDFLDFVAGARVYIHNANYDAKMLNAELARAGYPLFTSVCDDIVCTLRTAVKVRGRGRNRLDHLCDDYGVNRARRTHHGALLDCELLLEVMRAMRFRGVHFDGLPSGF